MKILGFKNYSAIPHNANRINAGTPVDITSASANIAENRKKFIDSIMAPIKDDTVLDSFLPKGRPSATIGSSIVKASTKVVKRFATHA